MSLEIRRLTAADDEDMAALGRLVVDAYQRLPGHPPDPEYDAELADVARRVERGVVFGAFDDGRPIGCVTYVPDPTDPHAKRLRDDEASFRMLAVSAEAQGRGVGAALVSRCVEEAAAHGRGALFIYSGDWMEAAHRLYARLGFERVPDRDWRVGEPPITLLGFRRPRRG